MRPFDDIVRIERAEILDKPAAAVRSVVTRVLTNRTVKDALHGVWLGHPLHPGLAAVAAGSFISATLLDSVGRPVGGGRAPSSFLIAAGGSEFRVADGCVVHGPATAPVPRFESRVVGDELQARVVPIPGVPAS